jgi:15-cis-phytoene synthase
MTLHPDDLAHCRATIRTGSLSFYAASRLLPARVRDPALVLYAFCRHADDEVDEGWAKAAAVLSLRDRLDLVYQGRPLNRPEDRAFAAIVAEFDTPQALPEALLEGLAWDAQGRTYASLSDVRAYSARVAAAVGAMMCVLMRVRDAHALARACDLGVAMQLTNIARDVGEDARAGRLYLPLDWLAEAGVSPAAFLAAPAPDRAILRLTERLLSEAKRLYLRAEPGIGALPLAARPGIWSARLIYDAIGGRVRAQGHDSITRRARTGTGRKLALMTLAAARTLGSVAMPQSAVLYAPPLPEVAWLVHAAARPGPAPGRTAALLDALADLAQNQSARGA